VGERGPESAQGLRETVRHPCDLAPSRQDDLLDPLGDETGEAGDGGHALLVGERHELSEQIRHVRLVSGPAAAEDIGVDHDERLHAASSR
jgi:hypothetical protein